MERAAQRALKDWESRQDDAVLAELRQLQADGTLERAPEDFRAAVRPGKRAVSAVAEVAAHWSFDDAVNRAFAVSPEDLIAVVRRGPER